MDMYAGQLDACASIRAGRFLQQCAVVIQEPLKPRSLMTISERPGGGGGGGPKVDGLTRWPLPGWETAAWRSHGNCHC